MRKLIITLIASFSLLSIAHTQIVKVKEYKSENKLEEVKSPYFVDINATLKLEIDKAILLDSLVSMLGEQQYPAELLQIVNNTVRQQQQIMLDIMMTGDRKKRLESLSSFRSAMLALLTPLAGNQQTLQGTALYQAVNTALGTNDYSALFTALNDQYNKVNQEYTDKVNQSTAYMTLGGWINTASGASPIHLEGFDSLKNGEYYEVKRIVTSIPQSEVDAYNAAQNLADSLQSNADTLVYLMKSRFLNGVDDVESKVTGIIDNGVTTFETRLDSVSSGIQNKFDPPLRTFKQRLNNYKTLLVKVVGQVENFSFGQAEDIFNNVKELAAQTDTLETEGKAIYQLIKTEIQQAPGIAKSLASELTADFSSVITQLEDLGKSYISELENTLDMFDQNKISDLKESAVQFSESSFKLDYNCVPSEVELDLKYTGQRKAGDQIYFKAIIAKDSTGTNTQTIYWNKLTMFRMGIHNSIRALLIFADKVNGDFANSTNNWQLAPSYSVVFKVGTRQGLFYNKYLTPGLGVNVSTLDFDNNNNPEIGIGLSLSLFKDYLQGGYGMNMSTDDGFWFFGLRLPLFGWANDQGTVTPAGG